MTTLHRLPIFDADLVEIWLHVAEHDPIAADRLIDRLVARLDILEQHPKAGQARPEIASDCRQLVEDPVLILYRCTETGVELVRARYRGWPVSQDDFQDRDA
ncbi:hypothetical protein JANAI62_37550 [Jannaschia pagri]|uniref:Toxin ParE1/3/4 n=1 Tax=Jannaschia pagri TaxID=2829797 RepID=A0ABQ4NRT7_9RHOB|nr:MULTISPECIES: type II toxin-antitoxin system RelE/ParE family toxin [unclassified Jannaschia]GIT93338.1 hypothetical protein JANAI61_37960 [Jannaschia sp. AI_61]GIT97132.1 hypothetical protein JANAI62_37550 [Jannaschia sp. AI_62]